MDPETTRLVVVASTGLFACLILFKVLESTTGGRFRGFTFTGAAAFFAFWMLYVPHLFKPATSKLCILFIQNSLPAKINKARLQEIEGRVEEPGSGRFCFDNFPEGIETARLFLNMEDGTIKEMMVDSNSLKAHRFNLGSTSEANSTPTATPTMNPGGSPDAVQQDNALRVEIKGRVSFLTKAVMQDPVTIERLKSGQWAGNWDHSTSRSSFADKGIDVMLAELNRPSIDEASQKKLSELLLLAGQLRSQRDLMAGCESTNLNEVQQWIYQKYLAPFETL